MNVRRGIVVTCMLALTAPVWSDVPNDTVGTLPAVTAKNRIYIADIALNHIADGKLHVVDGETGNYLGVIGTGFTGQFILSNDKREIIIATGYYSRGQRGDRVDVVEVWDADKLSFKYEIPISEKRASALNYEGLLRLSADGRWLFVQNATPATSVTVVDMQAKKDVGEISMPGCWAIYPTQSNPKRFASLCGEGNVTTVTLDENGKEASRTASGKFFDPDNDAWFMQGEQDGDLYHFVSFKGNIATVNVGGETAVLEGTWPLLNKTDQKKAWRPGGYQPLAVHPGTNRLYVTMHSGGVEGSHKNPANEIWAFDTQTKKRVARLPGNSAIALEPSADGKRLYAIDPIKASVVVWDKISPKAKVRLTQVGELPGQIEAE
jgi:methylamine dehydrogenase heavy chain